MHFDSVSDGAYRHRVIFHVDNPQKSEVLDLSRHFRKTMVEWGNNHCSGLFRVALNTMWFEDEQDVLLVKLKFS